MATILKVNDPCAGGEREKSIETWFIYQIFQQDVSTFELTRFANATAEIAPGQYRVSLIQLPAETDW